MPTAYSYIRYSSFEQGEGDSVRRQNANRDKWLKDHPDVPLDTRLKLIDKGKTGFDRENLDTYALGEFIREIEKGTVVAGDYLLVENLDRLSREEEDTATHLFLSITQKHIVIVQLFPTLAEFRKPVKMMQLIQVVLEFTRAHGESVLKSDRIGAAWADKKHVKARAGVLVTNRVPVWIVVDPKTGARSLDPDHTKTVRRMFRMAIAGEGCANIAKKLHAEQVPVMGRKLYRGKAITWTHMLVYAILTSTATYGEYQPRKVVSKNRRQLDGPPVPDYYAPAVDRKTFDKAAAALASRKGKMAGRRGLHVNMFSSLMCDARDGTALTYHHYGKKNKMPEIIPCLGQRAVKRTAFPATPFENAILDGLAEVGPADVAGEDSATKELADVATRIAKADAKLKLLSDQMDEADDRDTLNLIRGKMNALNASRREWLKEQAALERAAANPISIAWGETCGLLGMMRSDPSDEMRLKIRAALRRSIVKVHCLFVGVGKFRAAYALVEFRGGATRSFLVGYEPGRSNRYVRRESRSELITELCRAGGSPRHDLRTRAGAADAEKWLRRVAERAAKPHPAIENSSVGVIGVLYPSSDSEAGDRFSKITISPQAVPRPAGPATPAEPTPEIFRWLDNE